MRHMIPTAPRLLGLILAVVTLTVGVSAPVMAADSVKKLKKKVAKFLAADEVDQAISVVREIGASGDEDAAEVLYSIGKISPSEAFHEAVVSELLRQPKVLEYLTERFDKARKNFQEKVYVADAVGRMDSAEARAALVSFLEDKNTFVRQEVVRGLQRTMHRDAIGPLIDLLEDLSGRRRDVLYHEVRDALYELTGQDFDLVDDWKSWWEPNSIAFDPKAQAEKKDGATGVRKKRRGEDPEFFDVPVNSKNILFVIDTSGSMNLVEKGDIPGLTGVTGGDKGSVVNKPKEPMTPANQRLAEFWTRMEMAKRELYKVVQRLEKDTLFNIMRFDNNTAVFNKRGLVVAKSQRGKALKYVKAIRFRDGGATNTAEALEKAFKLDPKINTIFFLSDGVPQTSPPANDPTQPILDMVFKLNKFRKIKIHTFGYSEVLYPYQDGKPPLPELEAANKFLKELAEKTGGTFTVLKVDPKRTPDNPDGPPDKEGEKKKKNVAESQAIFF
ncbi:MAG: HEAT repeat domain-containing protein [Planctomycetota bacterium]